MWGGGKGGEVLACSSCLGCPNEQTCVKCAVGGAGRGGCVV